MTLEQRSSRDVPEGFAICTGRIPNEQHGSKAPTQWTCGGRGVLHGGFARCGACCPENCMVQGNVKSGRARRGPTPEQKVVETYPKGMTPVQKSSRNVPEGDGPLSRKVIGTYPKGLQYAQGAYRMTNMVQRRLPNGLAGGGAFCTAGLQGAGRVARRIAWCRKSNRDVPEGFAICTGRIPNDQHGSKAPTQWTCGGRGVLHGGFARCGACCPENCMVQGNVKSGRARRGPTPEQKVVETYPKGMTPVQKSSRNVPEGDGPLSRKVIGTYPKGLQYAQGAYRMTNMVQRRLPNGLAGGGAFCTAGLQGAGRVARRIAWCRKSNRDVPEGFAICTGRIPNDQHGSKAPTQWTCGGRGVLHGGFARCGACCPENCMVQGNVKSGRARRGPTPEQKVVETYPKGMTPVQKSSRNVPEGDGPLSRKVIGTYPKGLQYAQGAYRMTNMVQRRLPNGLAGGGAFCTAGLQGAGRVARRIAWCRKSNRDVPEGFAICTGRIPNDQHGSKAPTQWTCGGRGVLHGGFARCGACCPENCMVQGNVKSGRARRGPTPEQKVVETYPKGMTPVQKSSRNVPEGDGPLSRKVIGTYPKGLQYAQGAYRMTNMVQRRLPNGLAGGGAFCTAGLQGAGRVARRIAWCRKSNRDVPEGFAICTGRIPNDQHGSKAPTQWTCGGRGVLHGGFARCGACCPENCMVQGNVKSGRARRGPTPEQKVVETYPKGMTPVQKSSRNVPEGDGPLSRKVIGTYPKRMTPEQESGRDVFERDDS
ncbi:hypothetical protein CRG98_018492 [Punica granatum]|uniref:Uncharacterized protein n=1 Tax=Punica granatum TaxID=22663 RepID=A0A2I0JXY3_PUNGR|nr:hypothetical protein CRG98_018492 [Punica granatum]